MTYNNILFIANWVVIAGIILLAITNLRRFANGKPMFTISTKSFIAFGIIGGTFCIISADYYNYTLLLERLKIWSMSDDVEPVYWAIAKFVDYNIFYFRAIILVVYYLMFALIIKQLDVPKTIIYNIYIVLLFLGVTTIIRSSVADAIMWLGIIYFYRSANFFSLVVLIILGTIGYIAHKSSFMVVFIFVLSYIPIKKYLIQLCVLCIPIAIIILRFVVPLIFDRFFETSEYNESTSLSGSMIGAIKFVLNLLFTAIWGIFVLYKVKRFCISELSIKLYRVCFWGYYFWFVFCFSGASRYIGERLYAHVSIPLLYLISLLFYNASRRIKLQIILFMIVSFILTQFNTLVVWAYHEPFIMQNTYI